MILMPIVYVTDMDESIAFYERLGFPADPAARSRMWTQLVAGDGAVLALHRIQAPLTGRGAIELALVASEPLDGLRERLMADGINAGPIVDEAFGHSMKVTDPDGLVIQINKHEH